MKEFGFEEIHLDFEGGFLHFKATKRGSAMPDNSTMTDIYVQSNANGKVWIDSYGYHNAEDDYTNTVYGWIPADDAEAIGIALITAAKHARKEKIT